MTMYGFLTNLGSGQLELIRPDEVKAAFVQMGANFDALTDVDLRNLAKYGSKARGTAVRKLFGAQTKERMERFFADSAVRHNTRALSSGSRVEGLKGLVYDLVSYAAGAITWERFQEITEARLYNWTKPHGEDRKRVEVAGEMKAPASFPAAYALELRESFVGLGMSTQ